MLGGANMNEMIKQQGIVAMELPTPYSPVIHNPKAIANLKFLDGKLCSSKLEGRLKSAVLIELEMKLRWN